MSYSPTGWRGVGDATADALQACLGDKINLCGQHFGDNPLLLDPCIETAKQQCATQNPAAKPSSSVYAPAASPVPVVMPYAAGGAMASSTIVKGAVVLAVVVAGAFVAKRNGWIGR